MVPIPGPHVVLITTEVQETVQIFQETVRIFQEVFREKCMEYMIIVFTGKYSLSEVRRGCTMEWCICTFQKDVADAVGKCKYCYVAFEKKVEPESIEYEDQVDKLLEIVDHMVQENGAHYN